jgi:hypothetical protein
MGDRNAGDEINRELYIAPSLIGDSEDDPLLDQAVENVAEEVRRSEEARDDAKPAAPHRAEHKDKIIFETGPKE